MTDRVNCAAHAACEYARAARLVSVAMLFVVGVSVQELWLLGIIIIGIIISIIILARSKTHGGRFSKLPG